MSEQQKIWTPQPKQRLFMSAPDFEVLYGGAAGGGKSDALLMEGLRQIGNKNYKGIIFRRTYQQLDISERREAAAPTNGTRCGPV